MNNYKEKKKEMQIRFFVLLAVVFSMKPALTVLYS